MTTVWQRIQLRLAGTTPARRFQEEADVGVAAVLSCFRGLKLNPQNADKDPSELFDEAVGVVGKKKFEKQKEYVQNEISKQLQENFEAVLKMPSEAEKNLPKMSLSGFERTSEVGDTLGISDDFQKLFGFTLDVAESSVSEAEEGVKLRGSASIGSLVALYPGVVYLPEHYKKNEYMKEISNNPFARARFDSVIIDAKNESSTPRNPLAVAHKINHPPSGTPPNVLAFGFEFPPEEPFTTEEYDALIPNRFVKEPSRLSMFGKRTIVHGLAFIAMANIEDDEELFLNYRYNPDRPLPKWYTPVDIESDRAMWK
ncbi:hypothetical protein BBO99_00000606 [Phytophthora kernoviae]|uniref:SET domain-containing protein n=2 Tax=Phytophthora kernoviae TaxID=325452 RepID=A0A3R7K591_9STRA|nr:hypothetical protein G195_001613 [Phytophthora kernoviae 00238/432]KAG2523616.1 hypothetical protein JM16_005299 [Phytophthora kernoviae]KAG2532929.1 hypothetical protein JM18_000920 [Phytophthora kernoviae]RLN20477.1 hypothetical protein BBI17_005501 [Phytophthora kernoviae]RLN85384.1 hypothetical protein BBO99_00000606 [Phytophthora kernoviae]